MSISFGVFESSVLDVDTIQEGSKILVLDNGGLLDSGTSLGNLFKVNTLEGEVVLFFFLLGDEDSLGSVDSLVHLEAQEVLDFDSLK